MALSPYDFGQVIKFCFDEADQALRVSVVSGSFSVTIGAVDDTPFVAGTDRALTISGFANDTAPDSVDEGDAGAIRMSLNRNMYIQLRDGLGNERGAAVTAANALKTDASATTQPISAASLPLPTGAATSAKQPALGTAGTASTDVITVQGIASMTALLVDGSATTQPVSGTVTVTQATGTNLHAVIDSGTVAATQSGTWTVQPGNTANTTPWLTTISQGGNSASVSASNALKVDGSAVTQPVSGTVTANIGTTGGLALDASVQETHGSATGGTAAVESELIGGIYNTTPPTLTDGQQSSAQFDVNANLKTTATQSGTWNINNVSGTVSLPTGASTAAKQPALGTAGTPSADVITVQGVASMTALLVDGSATTQPVSGTVTVTQGTGTNLHTVVDSGSISASQSGTWNINNISGTISLPTGAATETSLAKLTLTQGSTTSGQSGTLVQGAVTTAAPTYTTAQTSPLSLTTAGALRTDSSGSTQPVSGTVTVTQGTGTNLHTVIDSGTVAATQSGTWTTRIQDSSGNSLNSTSNALNVSVTNASIAVSQSGTFNVRNQDGSGNAITSTLSDTKRGLNTFETGASFSEFVRNDYSSVNVTTGAYVELIASTAETYEEIEIFDSSGQTLKIAFGAAASEIDKFLVFPGGNGKIRYHVPVGTRVSIRAVSATASVGEISINLYG